MIFSLIRLYIRYIHHNQMCMIFDKLAFYLASGAQLEITSCQATHSAQSPIVGVPKYFNVTPKAHSLPHPSNLKETTHLTPSHEYSYYYRQENFFSFFFFVGEGLLLLRRETQHSVSEYNL